MDSTLGLGSVLNFKFRSNSVSVLFVFWMLYMLLLKVKSLFVDILLSKYVNSFKIFHANSALYAIIR